MIQNLLADEDVKKQEIHAIFPAAELDVPSEKQIGEQSEALLTLLEGDKSASYNNWTPT